VIFIYILHCFFTNGLHPGTYSATVLAAAERQVSDGGFLLCRRLSALLKALAPELDLSARTVTGKTLGENISGSEIYNKDVIRTLDNPVYGSAGLAILRGNLAPNGAVIKSAAEPRLLKHSGSAIVFDSYDEMKARIDD
jgi:dihydroxyacid dehydratase/phosphogluconate dehydratase